MHHIHIDSINVDSLALVHGNIPKKDQKTGKRLPFFYFWVKDHFYQRSPANFKKTAWSFSDDPKPIESNPELQQKLIKDKPDIIGLGVYGWNIDIVLKNAEWYRKNNPNALIIAGGPSAEATKEFLSKNPAIDLVILGPGIEIFRRVIDACIDGVPVRDVEGVSYLKNHEIVRNKPLPRKHDPLLINFVENFREEVTDLINSYHEKYKDVIFQSYFLHGCPYSCSFCEQGTSLWTKVNRRPIEYMYKEIDFLVQFKNIDYEIIDQNFGIVKEYIDLVKYFIAKNVDNNVSFVNPTMAKNNIDNVFEIIELINSSSITQAGLVRYSYLALQDTNPDVLKLNGRPMSNEFEKIEKFKEVTKHQRYNLNQVDVIVGLPGQSYETLSNTLYELFHHDLLSQRPPNLYRVIPNSPLTDDNKIYYETGEAWHRMIAVSGMKYIELDGVDYTSTQNRNNYLIRSDTLNPTEIMTAYYMFVLLSHVSGMTRWIDTPLKYLKNYHGKTDEDFVKSFTKFFNPDNRHLLPDCVAKDLDAMCRWFTGKDKFLMRRDNDDIGFLVHENMPRYRFHFNYDEMSDLFHRILSDTIGKDDVLLRDFMKWQRFMTFLPGKEKTSGISYNYDDIAGKKSDVYYLSNFDLKFDLLDRDSVLEKLKHHEHLHLIPEISWTEIDAGLQQPLHIAKHHESRV
tara:strand:- start:652 stop:2694 length:2043 start_codon:yes stop_codon:yes gene_type:complete